MEPSLLEHYCSMQGIQPELWKLLKHDPESLKQPFWNISPEAQIYLQHVQSGPCCELGIFKVTRSLLQFEIARCYKTDMMVE